jgi:biotin transport system permease protein
MLSYEPGETLAHRFDARAKLGFQIAFAIGAFGHSTPEAMAVLSVLALVVLASARVSPPRAVWSIRFPLILLAFAPLLAAATLGPPWLDVEDGLVTALASYRVVLLLLVSTAYVVTTAPRASRAAIQWAVPGRPGVVLGIGVSLVFRFLPVLHADLRRIRDAIAARGGQTASYRRRVQLIGVLGVARTFRRANRLALALQARCFSWNPTLPALSAARLDVPVVLMSAGLLVSPLL